MSVSTKAAIRLVRNRFLKALPAFERRRIVAELEMVDMPRAKSVTEIGQPMKFVYFPETCMVSVVSTTRSGTSIEVGIIGCRGMAALPVFLGFDDNLVESFVQVPGRAGRIPAETFRASAGPGTALYEQSLRYTSFFIQQVARSAACNALHRLEQRCARWLLLASEELGRHDFSLTHEYLAEMLGVRRASITDIAAEFSQRGLVRYSRARVRIIDVRGLSRAACECYRMVSDEAERMLSAPRKRGASSPR